MGYTSEERDHLSRPLCGAMTKRGVRCRAFAGQGVEGNPGVGSCKYHGGATTAHKTHAIAVEAQQRLALLGEPIEDVTAPGALMALLRATAGHFEWLRHEMPSQDLATREGNIMKKIYDDERDRLTRVGEACIRAGIAEHIVRFEQDKTKQTATWVRAAATEAGLNDKHVRALGLAMRKLALETGDGDSTQAMDELAKLRAEIEADDQRRIRQAAQKLSGLTYGPPEEQLATALAVRTDERGRRTYKRRSQSR